MRKNKEEPRCDAYTLTWNRGDLSCSRVLGILMPFLIGSPALSREQIRAVGDEMKARRSEMLRGPAKEALVEVGRKIPVAGKD